MNEKTNNIYNIKLTTITPVSIGDGGVLSPLSDYIYDNDNRKIYLINHKEFEKKIEEIYNATGNEEIITEYVTLVKEATDKEKTKTLKSFIEDSLNVKEFRKLCYDYPYKAKEIGNPLNIQTCIKNGLAPYISGSTLKGALKGVLLYDWLISNNKKVANNLSTFIKGVENITEFEEGYKYIENMIFGDVEDKKRMDFSLLKISDTTLLSKENLCFYKANRIDLTKKEKPKKIEKQTVFSAMSEEVLSKMGVQIDDKKEENKSDKGSTLPILLETIEKRNSVSFSINITKENENLDKINYPFLKFLQKEDAMEELFNKINNFSKNLLEYELQIIKKSKNNSIKNYEKIVKESLNYIKNCDKSTCYLRIGKGKNYFHNSIALSIMSIDYVAFNKLVNFYFDNPKSDLFPKTRTLLSETQLPLGWIKLELHES